MALTLAQPAHRELVIRKRRFIACVQAVPDRAQAQVIVAQLRAAHPQAAHVCWALLAGAQLGDVAHGDEVELAFNVEEDSAVTLTTRLNEAGQGALRWLGGRLRI